jgi:hypothetical protein
VPGCIEAGDKVHAYVFQDAKTKVQLYWRDVGNVDAYYEANLELTFVAPELNLYDEDWPIWTYQAQLPPAKFVLDDEERHGRALNSMVSGGCIVSGALVRESCCSATCASGSSRWWSARSCCRTSPSGGAAASSTPIIDEETVIPDDAVIGEDPAEDRRRFYVTRKGVVLVTREMMEACEHELETCLLPRVALRRFAGSGDRGGGRLCPSHGAGACGRHACCRGGGRPGGTGRAGASFVEYGEFGGYLARPAATPRAGLIVIHEWWGLNDNIREMSNRLAAEGYWRSPSTSTTAASPTVPRRRAG